MQDFEKLGVFYLGREYDPDKRQRKDDLVLYDSKDLVTHAVCVGMTGSGKTGLCIGLIEEAAIDGIPSIVVDPKGDLTNLLLTFPQLRPEDFRPWINESDAVNKGLSADDYAGKQADLWRNGLADWGESGERIQRLRDAAEFAIYTPGSNAGIPISILKSFSAPPQSVRDDSELLHERVNSTVTSLLGFAGIDANPLQSREHILLSTLLETFWKQGTDLDLIGLIQQIQNPPLQRIGAFDLESFFPSKERFGLAMKLNNLLAAPGFAQWMEGEALDIGNLIYSSSGKPRVCIFSIAHLNDSERMFFVSLLLTQVLGWMRTQSGTTSLRALFYMDEIFGYFPPVSNPPSKTPLLTLLKQARAFGLGIVLATQNPVDLDYKGLSNAGTWFIGRLQTERDKERLLEGLEGASASSAATFNRQRLSQILSGLSSRIFLMSNAHEDHPVVLETRWTLSYLRGPLTREQIKILTSSANIVTSGDKAPPASKTVEPAGKAEAKRPMLPPEIHQYFLPSRSSAAELVYKPVLFGSAKIYYADPKAGIAQELTQNYLADFAEAPVIVNWENAKETNLTPADLEREPEPDVLFASLPEGASHPKNYDEWNKGFADSLFRTQELQLMRSQSAGELSKPGESERDFRTRLSQNARERRDQVVERLRQKYAAKISALQERIRKAQEAQQREQAQASQAKLQTAISFGTTVLGALFGRKKLSATTLGRATTAARGVGRSMKESQDIERAQENVDALNQQLMDLQNQVKSETDALISATDPQIETLQEVLLKPKKSDIAITLVALAWAPYAKDASGNLTSAY